MSEDEALGLLTNNGMLVKRPLVVGKGFGLAGFDPETWAETIPT
jgi:arsenate reductase